MTWPRSYDPLNLQWRPLYLSEFGAFTDTSSRLVIACHESDVSFFTTQDGFRLTITGGSNALAATDIWLFPASSGGKTWDEIRSEMQTRINAAVTGAGGAGTVTVAWSGSSSGGSTGVYAINGGAGTTNITVAAPTTAGFRDVRVWLGMATGSFASNTWTATDTPNSLGRTGPGWIHRVITGGWQDTTISNLPRALWGGTLRDMLGQAGMTTSTAPYTVWLKAEESAWIVRSSVTDGSWRDTLALSDGTDLTTAQVKGIWYGGATHTAQRATGSTTSAGVGVLTEATVASGVATTRAHIEAVAYSPVTGSSRYAWVQVGTSLNSSGVPSNGGSSGGSTLTVSTAALHLSLIYRRSVNTALDPNPSAFRWSYAITPGVLS